MRIVKVVVVTLLVQDSLTALIFAEPALRPLLSPVVSVMVILCLIPSSIVCQVFIVGVVLHTKFRRVWTYLSLV
jgi:hypothetical protein